MYADHEVHTIGCPDAQNGAELMKDAIRSEIIHMLKMYTCDRDWYCGYRAALAQLLNTIEQE